MLRIFNYKIQWEVNSLEMLKKMLKVINPKCLDFIEVFDKKENKIIEKYNNWCNWDYDSAEKKTFNYMKKVYADKYVSYRLIRR